MNLSELIPFLESIGAKPKKGLSQNFLIDKNIIDKIVRLSQVSPKDTVLEVGPGPGALTEALLQAEANVIAVEKDDRFASNLARLNSENLNVVHQDALLFDYENLPNSSKVVANLPYNITTPLLEKFFEHRSKFTSLTLMMQKEVAMRIMAKPSTKEYGSLSIFVNFFTTIEGSFPVSRTCFYPKPKVDSTVIHLKLRDKLPLPDPEPFFIIVRLGFQQRRKMLKTTLKKVFAKELIVEALLSADLNIDARPEALTLEQWLKFFNEISKRTSL